MEGSRSGWIVAGLVGLVVLWYVYRAQQVNAVTVTAINRNPPNPNDLGPYAPVLQLPLLKQFYQGAVPIENYVIAPVVNQANSQLKTIGIGSGTGVGPGPNAVNAPKALNTGKVGAILNTSPLGVPQKAVNFIKSIF